MKQLLLVFIIVTFMLATVCNLNAQITIDADNMNMTPGLVSTKQVSDGLIEVDLGELGANQSWDFSAIEIDTSHEEYIVEPEGLPGADSFPEANIAMYAEAPEGEWEVYSFGTATADYLDVLGISAYVPDLNQTFIVEFEIEGYMFNYPINYGDEWDVVIVSDFMGPISIDSIHYEIDSWGTITDVAGEFPCLRMKEFTKATTQQEGEEDIIETDWSYSWLVPNFGAIVVIDSEDDEENADFTMGEFMRTTNIELVSVAHRTNPAIPAVSGLNPAFPNPFNPQTQLQFNVSQPGMVVINVYDPSGRVVSNVVNGFYAPGNYQTTFNALNLSSGTYFAKFYANNVSQTQRLLLTK